MEASYDGVSSSISCLFKLVLNSAGLDPMGAIIVSFSPLGYPSGGLITFCKIASGVIISWGRTIYTEFGLLAGKSAPHEFLQLIIYKAATFSDDILQLDTVRAYHVSYIP